MAQQLKDSFIDLERHRQLLEENTEKLRKSLRHWQTWEAEYEGLKEEISALPSTATRDDLIAISRDYEGDLVTKKEVAEILGLTTSRTTAQVLNILDRRIDYVDQNVRTVQKQMDAAEAKLAAVTIISDPDVRNDEGLPLTEIIEELDEEGNVTTSRTSTPSSAKPQLLEVLKKAGIKDLPKATSLSSTESLLAPASDGLDDVQNVSTSTKISALQYDRVPEVMNSSKKGVKFTEDTKFGPEITKSQTAKRIEDIMKLAKEAEAQSKEQPYIPTDESLEDAALRREMLDYGMSEVGSVVAELDLEDGSEWSGEDYDDDDDDAASDEDQYGRSRGRAVDDELRLQMVELEKRLGVRMMENIGNKASDHDVVQEGIGRVTINSPEHLAAAEGILSSPVEKSQDTQTGSLQRPQSKSSRKTVKFSSEVDIAPTTYTQPISSPPKQIAVAPVNDIVERTAPNAHPSSKSLLHPSKLSSPDSFPTSSIQFMPAQDGIRTVPTGPEGRTLASSVVERDTRINDSAVEPDQLDPQLLNQEVATEYHKMRNRMIQRQGGFVKEEESETVPFTEEEGGPKKLSRFKAARLARS